MASQLNPGWCFRVVQDGQTVASAWSTDRDKAASEAVHYARVYGQDGPVKIFSGRRRFRELEDLARPTPHKDQQP